MDNYVYFMVTSHTEVDVIDGGIPNIVQLEIG